jgi:hypothetical protein
MGNERLIRHGEREYKRAKAYRKALREAREQRLEARRQAAQQEMHRNVRKMQRSIRMPFFFRRNYTTHYYPDGSVVLNPRERNHPLYHFGKRCKPYYHGVKLRVVGFLTGNKEMRSRGLSLHDAARRDRLRRRRRREQELQEFARAMRTRHRY